MAGRGGADSAAKLGLTAGDTEVFMGTAPDLVLVGYALAERLKIVFVQLPETTVLEFYFQYKHYGKNIQTV
jgi:hypothetical protein